MSTSFRFLTAVCAASLTLGACSASVEGQAQATEFDRDAFIAGLDTGDYAIEPRDFVGDGFTAGDFGPGVEGQRLAEFVAHPSFVDDSLEVSMRSTGVSIGRLTVFASDRPQIEVADRYGLITSFTSARREVDNDEELGVSVWRFPDAEAAVQAANRMHELTLEPSPSSREGDAPPVEVTLPGLPATKTAVDYLERLDFHYLESVTPLGPHVIYTFAGGEVDESVLRDRTERLLDEQIPLLEQFPYTPVDEMADLPVDVDRVLARTVAFVDGETAVDSHTATYGVPGALHFIRGPHHMRDLLENAGVDRVGVANSIVYRAADPEHAAVFRDALLAATAEDNADYKEVDVPQDIPGATCLGGDNAEGRGMACVLLYDRYVAEIGGESDLQGIGRERTVPERLATQYVKFVRAEEMGLEGN